MVSQAELESAAGNVIAILKSVPELCNSRIAVIGGLALRKYLPRGRTTEDVDFIINVDSAPTSVKAKLLALPNTPFLQQAQYFFYKMSTGAHVQIDITPSWQSPYMPIAAKRLRDIAAGDVPYISIIDLIVFKIYSCGLRAEVSKKRRDAFDAENLLENQTRVSPLSLTKAQIAIVEPCIADVVAHGRYTDPWWRIRLGLPALS